MIRNIILENYRCFERHSIDLKELTIAVGKNNAGKSTIIEALRLVSLVTTRQLRFNPPPPWSDQNTSNKGVSPSLTGIRFSAQNIFHRYGNPPAIIKVVFSNNTKVEVFVGPEAEIYAQLYRANGTIIKTRKGVIDAKIPTVNLLPQISPLNMEEKVLTRETVRANLFTHLSSSHFRNQLKIYYDDFEAFRQLAESNWQGLHLRELQGRSLSPGGLLTIIIHDGDFSAEIGWMGHGLQMWLQTMWFLARARTDSIVILDEPDVYMHADLQRKLIRILKGRYKQVLLATHSVEIMAEVQPENILVIDKKNEKSLFTTSLPSVQKLIQRIGSIQNIGLARLWSARKIVLVEGEDIGILKGFQNTLFPKSEVPFDSIPTADIGGWGGWEKVKGADLVLKNGFRQKVNVYCILDSDYRGVQEAESRYEEAAEADILLHIWEKKELENYLLVPTAISRLILEIGGVSVDANVVGDVLDEICENLEEDQMGKIADKMHLDNRGWQTSTVMKKAKTWVKQNRNQRRDKFGGKEIWSRLLEWVSDTYNVSFSKARLAGEITSVELDPEVKSVISAIENVSEFE